MAEYSLKYCVWETTLACNLACRHCGSSAGRARQGELDTAEALDLVDQLADLGVQELTLSGGEFLVRPDWPAILQRVRERNMERLVISNGLSIDEKVADTLAKEGVASVSISIDGLPVTHNRLRPLRGGDWALSDPASPADSYNQLLAAMEHLRAAGVVVAAITQVSQMNIDDLAEIRALLVEQGVGHWQVQLTHPMGRAESAVPALEPGDAPRVHDFIRETQDKGDIRCLAADDVGWFACDEHLLRSGGGAPRHFWTGCQAGLEIIGIKSDGGVRGCLSMTDDLLEGNIRERPLREIWEDPDLFAYNRRFDESHLRGGCAGCAFGRLCRGGCHSLAHTTVGHLLDNPYCIRQARPTDQPASQ